MKMVAFCFWYFVVAVVNDILVLHFSQEPISSDGLCLRAFILTYCSVSYKLTKEKSE